MLKRKNQVLRMRQAVRDAADKIEACAKQVGDAESALNRAHIQHSQALDFYAGALRAQVYGEQKKGGK